MYRITCSPASISDTLSANRSILRVFLARHGVGFSDRCNVDPGTLAELWLPTYNKSICVDLWPTEVSPVESCRRYKACMVQWFATQWCAWQLLATVMVGQIKGLVGKFPTTLYGKKCPGACHCNGQPTTLCPKKTSPFYFSNNSVTTLPWEIQQSFFNSITHRDFRLLHYFRRNKLQLLYCSLSVYLLLFTTFYYLRSPILRSVFLSLSSVIFKATNANPQSHNIWRNATLSAVRCKSFAFYKVVWWHCSGAVSYTHLTLPTILRV